jgi:poly(A) polymerase/tRNA nucleotidyltransferase (CCA-adding enzyme)
VIELPGMVEIWDALDQARVVGGAVRDMLAGREIADVDFATPYDPQEVMARLKAAGIKSVPTGLAHGTVTAVARGRSFEITTLRRDVVTDGRHALVQFTDDWELDASRRDFTINAMSLTRQGEVFDYFGGREDLAAGRVRFVGAPMVRIAEDYLRIFRFFRFFARYGTGPADAEAVGAITKLREGVKILAIERVWSEVKKILAAEDPRAAVALMRETGVLQVVLPEAELGLLSALLAHGAPVDVMLRVAALIGPQVEGFAERWRLSGAERDELEALVGLGTLTPEASDAALRRALADEPAALLIRRSWLSGDGRPGWAALRARLDAMVAPVFPLRGADVTASGVAPGPRVGEVLRAVREWWMAGGCVADGEACRERLMAALDL